MFNPSLELITDIIVGHQVQFVPVMVPSGLWNPCNFLYMEYSSENFISDADRHLTVISYIHHICKFYFSCSDILVYSLTSTNTEGSMQNKVSIKIPREDIW